MKFYGLNSLIFLFVYIISGSILLEFTFGLANATTSDTIYPEISNTTSAEIPSDVNNPTEPVPPVPEISSTTSAEIPSDVNNPTEPTP